MYSKDADQFVKDVEELSRRVQVTHPGSEISDIDTDYFLTLLALRSALLEDLVPGSPLPKVWRRILMSVRKVNIYSYYTDMKECKLLLLHELEIGKGMIRPLDFNRLAGQHITNRWLLTVLKGFPAIVDPVSFRVWIQWFSFDEKANFPSIDYSTSLKEEYLHLESSIESWVYPDLSEYAEIMEGWLSNYSPCTDFCPRHGPGSVAEASGRVSPVAKCSYFQTDDRLDRFIREVLWYDPSEVLYNPYRNYSDLWRCNEFVSVPKSAITNRGISKEPTSLQWIQQGLSFHLMKYIESRTDIPITFRSQEPSRDLATRGSLDGSFGTIDLSAASDSVTLPVFCGFFHKTDLLIAGLESRSIYSRVRFDDGNEEVIPLGKFAPMGSALCFPVESLVFACICERAARHHFGRKRSFEYYQVFGDDIVVHSDIYPDVIRYLTELHFRINMSKSYAGQGPLRYREACGVESVNGVNITPFRISRGISFSALRDNVSSPGQYGALVDHCNNAMTNHLYCTQACLHKLASRSKLYPSIQRVGWYGRKINPGVSPHFLTTDYSATNYLVHSRTKSYLHIGGCQSLTSLYAREFRVLIPKVEGIESLDPASQASALWLWHWEAWRSSKMRRSEEFSERRASYFGTKPARWGWKWIVDES